MKTKDVMKLNRGEKILHKHYGVCLIDGYIPRFGPSLVPDSIESQMELKKITGKPLGTPFLETSFRLILNKLEKGEL
jgi:hypothetical protein